MVKISNAFLHAAVILPGTSLGTETTLNGGRLPGLEMFWHSDMQCLEIRLPHNSDRQPISGYIPATNVKLMVPAIEVVGAASSKKDSDKIRG